MATAGILADCYDRIPMSYELENSESTGCYIEADPMLGRVLNQRYRIESILGRGGMGIVYQARSLSSDRSVAIKAVHLSRLADPDIVRLFHAEAQAVSRLRHANTVYLIELGVAETGQPYLVMQLIQGKSLRHRLKNEGPLTLEKALFLFPQVMEALGYAHECGIVHRDLKPENILISSDEEGKEQAYVVDFGIAALRPLQEWEVGVDALVQSGIVGSPAYMSPEQCACLPNITAASDIYSLAVVIYESLAGRLPYTAKTAAQIMDAHIMQNPLPLKSALAQTCNFESVTTVLTKAMNKVPESRFLTVAEFQEEFCQAAKRDLSRVPSLKQRYESGSTLPGDSELDQAKKEIYSQKLWWQKLGEIVMPWMRRTGRELPEKQFCLITCPHCGEILEPEISFCLNCSRSRVNPQELSKIRATIGTYTLPAVRDLASSAQEKNYAKTRRAFLPVQFLLGSLKFLIALSVFLLISMLWLAWSSQRLSADLSRILIRH